MKQQMQQRVKEYNGKFASSQIFWEEFWKKFDDNVLGSEKKQEKQEKVEELGNACICLGIKTIEELVHSTKYGCVIPKNTNVTTLGKLIYLAKEL